MEKYQVIYKKRFQQKLLRLLDYLHKEWNLQVADDFIIAFQKKVNTISLNPNIGKQSNVLDVRTILITKHNRLYYRVKDDTIEIINMYDTRTNPKQNPYNPSI
jgi:plasmid stabilization system protein ParE